MNDIATIVQQLVGSYGPDIYRDRRRLTALLRDFLARYARQWPYNLLILSVQNGLLEKLIHQAGSIPVELLTQNHSRMFSESYQINPSAAQWVIEVWVHCFDLAKKKKTITQPVTIPPPLPLPTKPKPKTKTASPTDAQITNGAGMVFVRLEPGTFMMGSPQHEAERDNSESQHEVSLNHTFYLQITPVTQSQWQSLMALSSVSTKHPQQPITQVSWNDCQAFIALLNRQDSFQYRLPTEAEWEYAARAGTTTAYCFGDDSQCLGDYAWYLANSNQSSHPVQQKTPNAWGLFDMYGNVREWCQDWYGPYVSETQQDPLGPQQGSYKVCRGGSWKLGASQCRSASRHLMRPAAGQGDIGFRLVLVV